jgi:predicted DNA-binding protein
MSSRVNITIRNEKIKSLRALAFHTNSTVPDLIRECIDERLEKVETVWLLEEAKKIDRTTEEYTPWEDR